MSVPRIEKEIIRAKADEIRDEYAPGQLPVDIESLIDFGHGLTIQPVASLAELSDAEAMAAADGTIWVDLDQYMNERYQNRMRFSLAHEFGHWVLHRDTLKDLLIRPELPTDEALEYYLEAMRAMGDKDYSTLEYQANEFAGRLLVPVTALRETITGLTAQVRQYYKVYPGTDQETVAEYLAPKICKKFNVSVEVIVRRIKYEEINLSAF